MTKEYESFVKESKMSIEDKILVLNLEREYEAECAAIEIQCAKEGYLSRGCNYELRCTEARKSYDAEIKEIFEKYGI